MLLVRGRVSLLFLELPQSPVHRVLKVSFDTRKLTKHAVARARMTDFVGESSGYWR